MQLLVSQPPVPFGYHAGQYVEFLLPDETPRAFSIANAPNPQVMEFHIRHSAENSYTTKLVQHIKENQELTLQGPYGNMRYRTQPAYPLIFLAAGTGLAPCKALIEEALNDKNCPAIYLYWGVRQAADLYFNQYLIDLSQQVNHFHYYPILSAEGRIYEAVLKQHPDCAAFHIYASGPPEMVFAAREKLSFPPYFYSDWEAQVIK